MKAVRFHRFGGPEVLVYEDVPDPEPGPGEALLKIGAVGVNHGDLDTRAGVSRSNISLPHTLGSEFAGEVIAIRDRAAPFQAVPCKEGDRVWVAHHFPCRRCDFCLSGRDNLCSGDRPAGVRLPGAYTEMVKVPVETLHPLPSHVGFQEAAAAQIAFATTWHALINRAALQPGQTVLIHAAGSGVGSAAIQVAKLAGATVFTTASTQEKLQKAKELGADHLINYNQEDFAQKVLELTGGQGVDAIMEHIGGEVFTQSLECLKKDGVIVTVGGHGGEVVPLDIIPFFRRELRLVGSRVSTLPELRKVMGLVFEGKLKAVIHRALPLSQAPEAHRLLDSREVFGKVVLAPGG